jgi:hypothetical protein
VLSKRTMAQIGGDDKSDEWESDRPATGGKLKAPWLADTLARMEKKKRADISEKSSATRVKKESTLPNAASEEKKTKKKAPKSTTRKLSA